MREVLNLIEADPQFPKLATRHMQGRLAFDSGFRRGERVVWVDLLAVGDGSFALTVDPWTGPEKIVCASAADAVTAIKRELAELQPLFSAATSAGSVETAADQGSGT